MSIDAVVFKTFRKLGADDSDAAAFADELNLAIDRRYQLHAGQLATSGDVDEVRKEMAELKADLIKVFNWGQIPIIFTRCPSAPRLAPRSNWGQIPINLQEIGLES